jgi:hypothetical protein
VLHPVGPHAGGVDHACAAHLDFFAALEAAQVHARDLAALLDEAIDARARHDCSAELGGRARQGRGVPRIVELGVVVLDGTDEAVAAQRREAPQRALACEVPVAR